MPNTSRITGPDTDDYGDIVREPKAPRHFDFSDTERYGWVNPDPGYSPAAGQVAVGHMPAPDITSGTPHTLPADKDPVLHALVINSLGQPEIVRRQPPGGIAVAWPRYTPLKLTQAVSQARKTALEASIKRTDELGLSVESAIDRVRAQRTLSVRKGANGLEMDRNIPSVEDVEDRWKFFDRLIVGAAVRLYEAIPALIPELLDNLKDAAARLEQVLSVAIAREGITCARVQTCEAAYLLRHRRSLLLERLENLKERDQANKVARSDHEARNPDQVVALYLLNDFCPV